MRYVKALTAAATAALALTFTPAAQSAEKRTMCVFDILGANRDTCLLYTSDSAHEQACLLHD